MRVNIYDSVVKIMIVMVITTLFSSFSFISPINRLLIALLCIMLAYILAKNIKKKTIICTIILGVVTIYSLTMTEWPIETVNELFYFPIWVLLLNTFCDKYELYVNVIRKNKILLKRVCIIWNLIVAVSFVLKGCYVGAAFCSFAGSQHRFATCAFLAFSLAVLLTKITHEKKYLILCIIPFLGVMLTGARTYMLVVAAAAILVYYMISDNKYKFYFTIIPIVLVALWIIMSSSVMTARTAEMSRLTNYFGGDKLRAITSGRSVWWAIDMKHFFQSSIINQFLGNGFHFIRYVNTNYYGQNIWAHNDYVMLLGTTGYISLILYFYCYFRLCKVIARRSINNRVKILMFGFHIMNFLNAMFNMLYTYLCATYGMIFLLIVFFDDENFESLVRFRNNSHIKNKT